MKKLLLFVTLCWFCSCKKDKTATSEINTVKQQVEADANIALYGNWVGDFVATEHNTTNSFVHINKINLLIKKIENNRVIGKSIVAGNARTVSGTMNENEGKFQFILNEPGDDKYDGTFDFKIIGDTLSGIWKSFDKKLSVTERSFKLIKQKFTYNPKLMLPDEGDYTDYFSQKIDSLSYEYDGITEYEYTETYRLASDVITKINASTTKLEEIDLKNLKKLELEIIRNTIFARHGFSFKKKSYRQFFDPVAWYVPVSDDVSKELTPTEKFNIDLLKRFEKYAEDNYDSFGR